MKLKKLSILGALLFFTAFPRGLHAQAPGILWTTNLAATLFAVDAQTNVYANIGGSVITLASAGTPTQTNTICPVTSPAPTIARRDDSGNFYFLGNFDGTQDFGGITLVGGWTNWPSPGHWTRGYPTCFLAKYDSNGSLQWVFSFGTQAASNAPTDLLLDSNGGAYAGYPKPGPYSPGPITHINNSGSRDLETVLTSQTIGHGVTLGGLTSSNFCVYDF